MYIGVNWWAIVFSVPCGWLWHKGWIVFSIFSFFTLNSVPVLLCCRRGGGGCCVHAHLCTHLSFYESSPFLITPFLIT